MNNRLQQFLAAENISQSQFADTIGVARASISHILAGRNKPGFDFIESMCRHYPALNIDWLILGTGKMYKSQPAAAVSASPKPSEAYVDTPLFQEEDTEDQVFSQPQTSIEQPSYQIQEPVRQKTAKNESQTSDNKTQLPNNQKIISKIIVFYSDNTYQELK